MAEEQIQEETEAPDSQMLSMSDEDLLKMSPQEFLAQQQKANGEEKKEEEEEEAPAEEPEPEPETEPEEELEEETPEPEYEEEEEPAPQDVYEETEETEEQETEAVAEQQQTNGVDYRAEYEKLLAPFRASKREIQVNSVEDARHLMQMGADYQVKMQALKPQMRVLRTLNKANLLDDESKLDFLIDLNKGSPQALKKYLQDHKIDPMDLDLQEETQYTPPKHMVSEEESALDDVLDKIRDTESFDKTIDELGNKWDSQSKNLLMQYPDLIEVINGHITNGVYDQIMNTVQSERLLGRLQGLNDLMAYKQVGDALQAKGAFTHLSGESKPERKRSQDPKLKARKRAASPTKRSTSVQPSAEDFNPLSMSDDEFEKMARPRFN